MTSEIKVDTISEQTSANGVTIDGLTIKDGNIIGDVALAGTTPTFTVGDGGAEDAALIFDGNAVDYYIALDDSADNLIIGSGSTVGSNSLITIDSDGDFTLDSAGDIILDAHDNQVIIKDSGTEYGGINKSSNSFNIFSTISDGDIIFTGNDGGASITALTLDMSAAGAATFNAGFTAQAASTITTADNTDTLTLTSTDADANNGPKFVLNRDSGSPADGDNCGIIKFKADDDGGNSTELVNISAAFTDVSNGSEDATFNISSVIGGSQMGRIGMSPTETVFNDDSGDIDFRVESNGQTHMIHVDAGSDHVNIAGGGTDGGGVFNVFSADNTTTLSLVGTDSDASAGPILSLERSANSAATDDLTGSLEYKAQNDANQNVTYARLRCYIGDATDGSEDSVLQLMQMVGGTERSILETGNGEVAFNEDSQDINFRVESNDNNTMFHVDAGRNEVGVGSSNDYSAALLSYQDATVVVPEWDFLDTYIS